MGFGNQIPVVQGIAVPVNDNDNKSGYYYQSPSYTNTNNVPYTNQGLQYNQEGESFKGQAQPKRFNDLFFAIAFYVHLAVIGFLFVAAITQTNAANGGGGGGGGQYGVTAGAIPYCAAICGVFATGISIFSLGFMMKFPATLIKMSLIFTVGLSLVVAILGLIGGQILMGCLGLLFFAFGCCYACAAWSRIPFAAANMNTGLTAVRANLGLLVIATLVLAVAFGWSIVWSVATGGMYNTYGTGILFLFLVSFYWTHQVLQNTMTVTTAGVIGTWWFIPSEASSCCSRSLMDSFLRATTFSFGSICFGSLLVAIVQALRRLQHMTHENEDFNMLACVIDCILACIEGILEYLNKWAYIYVGLYGYSYVEAGKNVFTLFETKGWTSIISDDLVDRALLTMSIGIGLCTGFVGYTVAMTDKNIFEAAGISTPGQIGFL